MAAWSRSVLAADDLARGDELIARLADWDEDDFELPAVAGYLAGARARDVLGRLPDAFGLPALGIALIGDPADLAFFKRLSTQGHGLSAKRIHGALAKPRLADRLAALDALARDLGSLGTLLALCKLIADPEPQIVERAARCLRDFVHARGLDRDLHATFSRRARTAIADGVTAAARAALDDIQAAIPGSAPFPLGPPAPARSPRAAAAPRKPLGVKARGLEMLDTLRDQLAPKPAAARDAALEAEIADDPDDAARYLVYADWLQTRSDARGLLITLHHAAHQHPDDKARAIAAQAFLDEHRHAFLGRLEPFVRERDLATVDLDWFMGFIKRARIGSASSKLILDALGCLLETPSAMFLQELVIEAHGGPLPIDPDRVVAVLLEAKQPQTLAQLSIGKPGAWTIPPALRAVFPRLQRDPALAWTDAMAKAAAQRRLKIDVDVAQVPALVPRVAGVTVDMPAILAGVKAELDKQRPLGVLAAMPRVFEPDSLDAFARALAEQWEAMGETPRWPFDALGPLGGPRSIDFIAARLDTWSHQRAVQGIEHLARIGTDAAIYEIVTLALAGRGPSARRDAAASALDVVAKRRDLRDRDALVDRTCPPRATPRALATQRAWLESIMLSGYRIAVDDFRRFVAGDPIRLPLVSTLLWAECVGERLVGLVRVGARGELRRPTGEPFEPTQLGAASHGIGLVHPAELAPEELAKVARAFAEPQVMLQLERPVFWLAAEHAQLAKLTRFAKRRVGFYALQAVLEERGWLPDHGDDDDGYRDRTQGWSKPFPRDGVVAYAKLNETNGAIAEVEVRSYGGTARRFATLRAVTISELLWDLETAHGRAAEAPRPLATSDIVVERARSGRSKCVVCGEPIAKDALRIGVERMLETPTFAGRGTVWLHPECAAGAPELAGVDVEALLQRA